MEIQPRARNRIAHLPPLRMTCAEFMALPEYSSSIPTGTTPGKRWKRHDGVFDHAARRAAKHARPFDLYTAKATVDQFAAHGVPLFVKQLGHNPVWRAENGDTMGAGFPVTGKGTDMAEWPPELRVQQFPEVPV